MGRQETVRIDVVEFGRDTDKAMQIKTDGADEFIWLPVSAVTEVCRKPADGKPFVRVDKWLAAKKGLL